MSGYKEAAGDEPSSCDGCALVGRRAFVRDAGLIAAGVLMALGVSPTRAHAAPVELISALDGGKPEEKSYPLPAKDGTQIDKDNGTIVTRWQGKVFVF